MKLVLALSFMVLVGTLFMGTEGAYAMSNDTQSKKAVKIVQTAGRQQLGDFAPDFARYNDDILFGEVWSKNDVLSLKERSIVTVSALIAQGLIDTPLKFHMETAKKNGVTKDEMVEIITQLAFYSGWPKAWGAFAYAKEVYGDQ
ncbi:carboxymuconolactone decarboxylase family protein [Megasphaera sp. BIOML-A1]|nr:carboxymuconolactone decarboxylase family protein [Megasphaera sp. BIOML-A2]MSB89137.1 carboxymuconolactone decarboxylase family protein [Megasphaera sp. BIOML-A1]